MSIKRYGTARTDKILDRQYVEQLFELLSQNKGEVDGLCQQIFQATNSGSFVWIMGNGGSSSTAEHFETDLAFVRLPAHKLTPRAISITSNSSLITALGNDIGFERVFSAQLERRAKKGDLAILISASGNSINLVNANLVCQEIGVKTVGILGFDGGRLLDIVDFPILFKSNIGAFGPVEDAHLAFCHQVAGRYLETYLV